MPDNLLSRAREYEAQQIPAVSPSLLPKFHVTGIVGWLNDPNGFSLYKGEYHLFFQYYPYSTHWNSMHWGHVKTKDLIRWERLPCALAPDKDYDQRGCFSGSAIELRDGRHLLMYTGVGMTPEGKEIQTQCLAFGDGVDYVKYEGNPVITADQLPPDSSEVHFRDPKITEIDGGYRVVTGNLNAVRSGVALLFESEDAKNWRFVSELAASNYEKGRMWECPDLFGLDSKDVLLVSPQEMRAEELEFIEGNTTLCIIGELRPDGTITREHEQTIDYGLDFYAPQTTLTEDGRRVMIAWMQYWNSVETRPSNDLPFFGQMTLPRELNVRGGRLIQNPVRELNAYRGEKFEYKNTAVSKKTELPGVSGRCVDVTLSIRPSEKGFKSFSVNVAEGGDYVTVIRFDPASSTVLVDRKKSGWPEEVLNERTFAVRDRGGELKLRLVMDRYSLELFANDGEHAASFAIFAPQEADSISFLADGEAIIDVEKYSLDI